MPSRATWLPYALIAPSVAFLCALLMNGMTLVFFLMSGWITSCPSILETWHTFFDQSAARSEVEPVAQVAPLEAV